MNKTETIKKSSRLKNRLLKRLATRLSIFSAAAILVLTLLFFVSRFLFGLYTWQWSNGFYQFAKKLENNYILMALIILLAGGLIILLRTWLRSVDQLDEVLEASRKLYQNQTEPIKLSEDLQEFEWELNQIRQEVDLSQRQAKEAEQRKNDLIVYLAHDLKTPLTSVIGYLTLLRDEQEISVELRKRYLAISLDKAERLEELINEFFEIARFNLSNIELMPAKIQLKMMLEQLSYEFLPLLTAKNLTLEKELEEEISVYFDADKMQRVFDNLLQNAVNYSDEGAVIKLSAKTDPEQKRVKIAFTNQGPTIPPEKLSRIFEQFFRLDTARQTNRGGAGLGLAIAKQIVELHGGQLTAESEAEKTTFTIDLPLL
ncbi:ATPase/histidine kinase/DNA gyrase B/HSP90 domain protein [Enterococcus faecalis 13-SD-W-01]|nr:ATPase/histidine kinase/DNA gyrase B/HSP90 domain protein [Enterococcus faecalis 13-SD-W-01]